MSQRVAVVGGGIGGLAAARALHQRDSSLSLSVFEAASALGGVTKTTRQDGWVLEEGPDSLITIKPAGIALLRELGLGERMHGTQPHARQAFVVRNRRLVPVPEGLYLMAPGKMWPFVCTRLIGWRAKLRMALDIFLPRRPADAPEESLAQFVRRRLGKEALARIAQPMVGGIYTADPERLSVAATMPQFLDMEREHRSLILAMRQRAKKQAAQASASGPRYGLFASLPTGLQEIIEALAEELPADAVRLDSRVDGIQRAGDQWEIATQSGPERFDHLVLALPAHAASRLLRATDEDLAEELGAIPYASVATLNLGYRVEQIKHVPQGAGFVVPSCEHRCILACTVSSQKYPDRAPEGYVLLRAFIGGGLHEKDLDQSDDALIQAAHAELAELLCISGEPMLTHLRRWPQAMAQYVVGHSDRVQRIRQYEQAVSGLALVGNGYEGVGLPDVVAQAHAACDRLLGKADNN